jgi:plastocyanin
MKRFLLLVAALALVAAACGGGGSDAESASGANSNGGKDGGAVSSTVTTKVAAGNTVVAKGLKFKPATLRVKVGDEVNFKFDDGIIAHNAVADDGTFETDTVTKKTVTVTIPKAGRITYTCTIHPTMKGVIVAE